MLHGVCPRCNAQEVFCMTNGVMSGDKIVHVRGLGWSTRQCDHVTHVCTHCGYYEDYIADRDTLQAIAANGKKWQRVPVSQG